MGQYRKSILEKVDGKYFWEERAEKVGAAEAAKEEIASSTYSSIVYGMNAIGVPEFAAVVFATAEDMYGLTPEEFVRIGMEHRALDDAEHSAWYADFLSQRNQEEGFDINKVWKYENNGSGEEQ